MFIYFIIILLFILYKLGVTSPPTKPQRTYQDIGREAQVRSAQPPHCSPSSPPSNQQRPQSTPPRPPERWAYLARTRDPNSGRKIAV